MYKIDRTLALNLIKVFNWPLSLKIVLLANKNVYSTTLRIANSKSSIVK
ncbi:hypothetical protein [Tissierella pigra]|nr:hypothetical protein [Tissierella pigra]